MLKPSDQKSRTQLIWEKQGGDAQFRPYPIGTLWYEVENWKDGPSTRGEFVSKVEALRMMLPELVYYNDDLKEVALQKSPDVLAEAIRQQFETSMEEDGGSADDDAR